jgi:hypothetical protein
MNLSTSAKLREGIIVAFGHEEFSDMYASNNTGRVFRECGESALSNAGSVSCVSHEFYQEKKY